MTGSTSPGKPNIERKRKKRRLLLTVGGIFVIAVIGAGSYAYYEFNRENKDLKNVKPDITITTAELMKEFTVNFKTSDSLYKNKMVELAGIITKVDSTDMPVIIFFGEKNSMSSIQCSMDAEHHDTYRSLMPGNSTRLKGIYIGAISQDLFGIDIKLNRCVIIN
jgi:hypothetical protein